MNGTLRRKLIQMKGTVRRKVIQMNVIAKGNTNKLIFTKRSVDDSNEHVYTNLVKRGTCLQQIGDSNERDLTVR
jgi:hypothetical protein